MRLLKAMNNLAQRPIVGLTVFFSIIFAAMLGVACTEQTRKEMFDSPQGRANQITYVKDNRTGLCFVHNESTNGNGFGSDIFTNVPCNPEVERLLVKE